MLLLKFTPEQEARLRNTEMAPFVEKQIFGGREYMDGYALEGEEWFVPANWVTVVQDDRYILKVGDVTIIEDLPSVLKRIDDTPEGTTWSFYPAKDPSAVTNCPQLT